MKFLKHFYTTKFKYDLINKFAYTDIKKLPILNKIVLSFGCKSHEIKLISASLLALELITTQKGSITKTKYPNILLKIKKGHPVGCRVILRNSSMFKFISKTTIKILPKLKDFSGFYRKKLGNRTFSYTIKDSFIFSELENQYYIFNSLSNLHITFVCNIRNKKELYYLLQALKFPIVKHT